MAGRASLPLSLLDSRPPSSLATQPKRRRLASTPATPIDEVMALTDMKFVPQPPLPLNSIGFHFLKALNLSTVGYGLNDVPFNFGWELVVYRPSTAEFGAYFEMGADRSSTVSQTPSGTEGESGTDVDPRVSQTGSVPVWEDIFVDPDLDKRVSDSSESDSPTPLPIPSFPQRSRKRRFKVLAGRKSPPSSENLQLLDFTPTSYPPIPPSLSSKPSVRPTRKSSRLASQTRPQPRKQDSTRVEVLDSSSELSSSSTDWVLSEEPSHTKSSASPPLQSTSTSKPTLKRKVAPKQGPK